MDATTNFLAAHDEGAVVLGNVPLTLDEYTHFIREMEQQPPWRATADKEMDYADGNQLDSQLLKLQQERGIPPAQEDLIGPALLALQGYEATIRTDWRVTPNGQPEGQDVAEALNFKLNEAERHSKADRGCSNAFRSQAAVGIGWVEVSRESDPFKYPYRCTAIHRNEIRWDWSAVEDDLSDARYLRRERWIQPSRLAAVFPEHAPLIMACGRSGANWWAEGSLGLLEGGGSTSLRNSWDAARGWSVSESHWHDPVTREVCTAELWYRRWVQVDLITAPDGRVVEFDSKNPAHIYAVSTGAVRFSKAIVPRLRRSYWLGPHVLHDSPTPYSHRHFPYVPFWGFREDSTRVPYGYVRGVIYQQDSLNSGTATLRWGMGAVRTERTKGAVAMTDAQFRQQVARRDADIVLDAAHMAQPGAKFEVKRDYQLTDQHFQMLTNARAAIDRISAAPNAFAGRQGTATSGVQEQTQVEQSNQSLGRMMDNFRSGRTQVGELLMSMIVDDLGQQQHVVLIEGDAVRADKQVVINRPEVDPQTGMAYLSNDLQRTRLMVGLEDVPSSATYRGQQLNALSELAKSLPDQYKAAVTPYLVSLTDAPFRKELIEALRAVDQRETPEQVDERIKQAVADALSKSGADLKMRELDLKYNPERMQAEIAKIVAESVESGLRGSFAAMQAAQTVAQIPQVAPIADALLQNAGWRPPTPAGVDPNIPTPEVPLAPPDQVPVAAAPGDTSPQTPASPASPEQGMNQGIHTMRADSVVTPAPH